MTEQDSRSGIARKTVAYRVSGIEEVTVRREIAFPGADGAPAAMDVYLPRAGVGPTPPVVVLVAGYPDPGFQRMLGCRFKEMGSTVSWARSIAASGTAAIAYANRDPAEDLRALLRHVRAEGEALGVDGERLGVWASSGNAPLALWAMMSASRINARCAALLYPFTLDRAGYTAVADAARVFRFAHPAAGMSVADLRSDGPIFVARAGRDENPGLNETLDRFVADALVRNLPISVTNHPEGAHAFDLVDDGETSRRIIDEALSFLAAGLR